MNPQYLVTNGTQSDLVSGSRPEWKAGTIAHCILDLGESTFQIKTKGWNSQVISLPSGQSWWPYWNIYSTNDSITLLDGEE